MHMVEVVLSLSILVIAGVFIWHHINLIKRIESAMEDTQAYFTGICNRLYALEQAKKTGFTKPDFNDSAPINPAI